MERVRMQQEALARRHFDFDAEQERIECVLELLLISTIHTRSTFTHKFPLAEPVQSPCLCYV